MFRTQKSSPDYIDYHSRSVVKRSEKICKAICKEDLICVLKQILLSLELSFSLSIFLCSIIQLLACVTCFGNFEDLYMFWFLTFLLGFHINCSKGNMSNGQIRFHKLSRTSISASYSTGIYFHSLFLMCCLVPSSKPITISKEAGILC